MESRKAHRINLQTPYTDSRGEQKSSEGGNALLHSILNFCWNSSSVLYFLWKANTILPAFLNITVSAVVSLDFKLTKPNMNIFLWLNLKSLDEIGRSTAPHSSLFDYYYSYNIH